MAIKTFEVKTYLPMSVLYLQGEESVCCNDEGVAIVKLDDADKILVHWKRLGFEVQEQSPLLKK